VKRSTIALRRDARLEAAASSTFDKVVTAWRPAIERNPIAAFEEMARRLKSLRHVQAAAS